MTERASLLARQTGAPRDDEEIVFSTPWEARIFAMIAHLAAQKQIDLDSFRAALIAAINRGEETVPEGESGTPYYCAWLAAAEDLLAETNHCTPEELAERMAALSDDQAPGKQSPTGAEIRPVREA